MPKFMYIFHGGQTPATPEEGQKVMAAWTSWLDGIGGNLVDGGNPAGMSKTVTASGVEDNGGANPVSGYTLVNAPDMAAACDMAKGCPILDGGKGSIEVAEALEM
jgi:hypothetical protein